MLLGPLMVDLQTTALTAEERDLLHHPAIGGIILFARNYESQAQLTELVQTIRAVRDPLLIAVDQEGGRVQRFQHEFSVLTPLAKLGECYTQNPQQALTLAEEHAHTMARELLTVGVDFSFAPVLDVNTGNHTAIGERSFSANPIVVSELGRAYIHGMQNAGMAATGKHFPGHGAVAADSHHELPVDERPWSVLKENDLLPFRQLTNDLSAVMAAHVVYSQVDSAPAGFSTHWLQQVLRGQLSFKGVIFSDDLSMQGAAWAGNLLERTQAALAAGCDMALLCNDRTGVHQVLDSLTIAPAGHAQARLLAMRSHY